jgi:hypothetical protein
MPCSRAVLDGRPCHSDSVVVAAAVSATAGSARSLGRTTASDRLTNTSSGAHWPGKRSSTRVTTTAAMTATAKPCHRGGRSAGVLHITYR